MKATSDAKPRQEQNTGKPRKKADQQLLAMIGWECLYPAPPEEKHEDPEPCDTPGKYNVTPDNVWDGEGP